MAPLRSKATLPVGSAQWISNERGSALQFVQQEVEEFAFSARNEVDWLNEHMAEIFNNNPISITEVFKTPGKLRGKTPRTTRKRNALQGRAPLTDIFAPNQQLSSALQEQHTHKQVEQPAVGTKDLQPVHTDALVAKPQSKASHKDKENIDSGYHGTATDDSEPDRAASASQPETASQSFHDLQAADSQDTVPITYPEVHMDVDDEPNLVQLEGSREDPLDKHDSQSKDLDVPEVQVSAAQESAIAAAPVATPPSVAKSPISGSPVAKLPVCTAEDTDGRSLLDEPAQETVGSPSERSSPVQPVRKSSLSFAALPAREPLPAKTSIDHRVSCSNHPNPTWPGAGRVGVVPEQHPVPRAEVSQTAHKTEAVALGDRMDLDDEKHAASEKESEDLTLTSLHRKTSTQRLHERISQLGQSQQSRPTKSIPSFLHQASQQDHSDVPGTVAPEAVSTGHVKQNAAHPRAEDEKSWVPRKPVALPEKTQSAAPSGSSREPQAVIPSIAQADEMDLDVPVAASQEQPATETARENTAATTQREPPLAVPSPPETTTTEAFEVRATTDAQAAQPAPSQQAELDPTKPTAAKQVPKNNADGPISASKAKLSSILKSARGIFASSAGVSAQAKMETMSPATTMRLRSQTNNAPAEMIVEEPKSQDEPALPESSQQKAPEEPSQHQSQEPLTKAKESKRPLRPTKAAASKTKPVPVSIKVGTASQRELDNRKVNPPNTALASNLQQSLAPPTAPPAKQPANKTSTASLRKVTSNSSLRSAAANSGRPRALAAAARKKEQDEQEAQRKLEAKKEMERKKAAMQEEERRKEQQRKEMELQRQQEQRVQAEDAKKAARRQEIERRRLENARKQEQQRGLQTHTRARAGNDPATVPQQDKAQMHMLPPRGELNSARTVSKMTAASNVRGVPEEGTRSINHPPINPARPPKRGAPAEETEDRPQGPSIKVGPSYVQVEAKRRHTNEEDEAAAARQAMPPPMRQSTLRKDVANKAFLAQAYMNASSSQTSQLQGGVSTIKLTTPQHQPQMKPSHALDMNRFATAKIPFAEGNGNAGVSNAAIAAATATATSAVASASAATAGKAPSGAPRPGQAAKSSPQQQYRDGDAIELPEIPTDSEDDEDGDGDDNDFNVPDWAQSPALRTLLQAQQLVDPEQVFGPIAPLHMEEIFKNKDRHHRFRNRTSSANWSGADRLTQDEIQRDLEARRRLIANGEWSYGIGLS